jgi:hypothetical protein
MRAYLLAFALAWGSACAQSSEALDADDVERYRFAVDLGCRDAATRGGEPAGKADAYCRCVSEGLRRDVPEKSWRDAARLGEAGSLRQSLELLAPHMTALDHCREAPAVALKAPPLAGTWEWRVKDPPCTEVYTFRRDGTVHVVSADEKTDNTFELADRAEPAGRFRFTMTTTADSGGRDCAATTDDSTGKSATLYLLFNPAGDAFVMCTEPAGMACLGPLRRRK